jgi:hypothetical protein
LAIARESFPEVYTSMPFLMTSNDTARQAQATEERGRDSAATAVSSSFKSRRTLLVSGAAGLDQRLELL